MSKLEVLHRFSDIETDGVCINQIRDPPAHRSVYIPPGDSERETYRLSTFKDFPQNVPINPCQFAVNGFYYTGYRDRVKCFSCGQSCQNWLAGDDISSAFWHKRNCEFKNGTDTTNIPIGTFSRLGNLPCNMSQVSNQSWPCHTTLNETIPLAGTRSIQSSRRGNAMMQQTSTAITNQVNYLSSFQNHLASNTVFNTTVTNIPVRTQQRNNFSEIFPCLNPINPHMRRTEARLQTFIDNSRLWPSYRLPATPEEISDAGMYFLGEGDRVKCWYCNGGLQNWERDDDPWVEHAKWFPMCEYLLQRKGPDFVHRIVAQYPDLRRPTLRNPASASSANEIIRFLQFGSRNISMSILNPFQGIEEVRQLGGPEGYRACTLNMSTGTQFNSRRTIFEQQPSRIVQADNILARHRVHERRNRSISINSAAVHARSQPANEESVSNTTFPCLDPINPHMRRTEARLQTLIDNSRLWPSYGLRATPEEIADAGMYFGEEDRVKCWYCNGIMYYWTRDDDPWVEHAKWFPMCEYLLQRKGPDFVHGIVAQYPDLRRPVLGNPATASSVNEFAEIVRSGPRMLPQYPYRSSVLPNFIAVSSSNAAPRIEQPSGRIYGGDSQRIPDASGLSNTVLDIGGETITENDGEYEPPSDERNASISDMTDSELLEEIRRLEELRNCKSCHSNRACMVFIPCGHLACCAECGSDVQRCPICNHCVQERIKSYIC